MITFKKYLLLFLFIFSITSTLAEKEVVELPKIFIGEYLGTIIWGSEPKVRGNTVASLSIDSVSKKVTISFVTGDPELDASIPKLAGLQFIATPGSQVGVYESINHQKSIQGVYLSAYMTNMNLVNAVYGGIKVEFTGTKRIK